MAPRRGCGSRTSSSTTSRPGDASRAAPDRGRPGDVGDAVVGPRGRDRDSGVDQRVGRIGPDTADPQNRVVGTRPRPPPRSLAEEHPPTSRRNGGRPIADTVSVRRTQRRAPNPIRHRRPARRPGCPRACRYLSVGGGAGGWAAAGVCASVAGLFVVVGRLTQRHRVERHPPTVVEAHFGPDRCLVRADGTANPASSARPRSPLRSAASNPRPHHQGEGRHELLACAPVRVDDEPLDQRHAAARRPAPTGRAASRLHRRLDATQLFDQRSITRQSRVPAR